MSIRRKSTTHDLATLRLHPDGSRVQQSSTNARRRTAASTVVDARGNWIAKDAGGKSSVKKRRSINCSRTGDADGEFIDLSGGDDGRADNLSKGKQRDRDGQVPGEDLLREPGSERVNTRAKQRLSFMHDLSFLDSPPYSVPSLEQDAECSNATSAREPIVSFSDPASDLLKAIHHFACCYYLERGQLSDTSKSFRGEKKERHIQSQANIHTLAANALGNPNVDSETEETETENETAEEAEDEGEATDAEDSGKEGPNTNYKKDMYKAFDGSALMAIGIVLQEQVAHTLLSKSRTLEEPRSAKRRRTGRIIYNSSHDAKATI